MSLQPCNYNPHENASRIPTTHFVPEVEFQDDGHDSFEDVCEEGGVLCLVEYPFDDVQSPRVEGDAESLLVLSVPHAPRKHLFDDGLHLLNVFFCRRRRRLRRVCFLALFSLGPRCDVLVDAGSYDRLCVVGVCGVLPYGVDVEEGPSREGKGEGIVEGAEVVVDLARQERGELAGLYR